MGFYVHGFGGGRVLRVERVGRAFVRRATGASAARAYQFTVPMSIATYGTNGQSIMVIPLTTTTGSVVFDVLGYELL